MSYELRPITPEEWPAFSTTNAAGFGWDANPEHVAESEQIIELDRTLATFDGPEVVSTTAIYSFDQTVPGNALPCAGVTWVSVKPTHRRQGILRNMMQRQLEDVRERGEAIASLWASESIIYGRFGYGLAAQGMEFTIDRTRTAFAREAPACGRTRIVTRDEALEAWPAAYDLVCPTRPGFYSRSEKWWRHQTLRGPDADRRVGTRFFVQYEEDGRVLGFARYRVRADGADGLPNSKLSVQELVGANDAAYASLWDFIFGVDLVGSITAYNRPLDEPLYWMLADPRRMVRRPLDSLWLRVVDVPAALEGRRYDAEGRFVLGLRDEFCPWTEGRYELEAGADGARCKPSTAEPDIELSAADLGAIYLGGSKPSELARAGRLQGDRAALRRADAIFSWDVAPWCPEVF